MCTTFWSRNSSHLIHGLHILRPKFGVLRGALKSGVLNLKCFTAEGKKKKCFRNALSVSGRQKKRMSA